MVGGLPDCWLILWSIKVVFNWSIDWFVLFLGRGEYRQLMELKDERISFVDVDMSSPQDPVLYWSSRDNHVIYRQSLPKKRKERADFDRNEPVPLITNVQEPRGLAVDCKIIFTFLLKKRSSFYIKCVYINVLENYKI